MFRFTLALAQAIVVQKESTGPSDTPVAPVITRAGVPPPACEGDLDATTRRSHHLRPAAADVPGRRGVDRRRRAARPSLRVAWALPRPAPAADAVPRPDRRR